MTYSYNKRGRQVSANSAESIQNSDACRPEIGATHVITEVQLQTFRIIVNRYSSYILTTI